MKPLALINQTLDEVLAEQEGDFDSESRWALAWFEQFGFTEGDYGVAETLSKAKNTSVKVWKQTGILVSKSGKVRLLKPIELLMDLGPNKRCPPNCVGNCSSLDSGRLKPKVRYNCSFGSSNGIKAETAREIGIQTIHTL